jgi:hypothetical protein
MLSPYFALFSCRVLSRTVLLEREKMAERIGVFSPGFERACERREEQGC